MHVCPHCGAALNAPASYCDKTGHPLSDRSGVPMFLFLAFGGFAIAAILLIARALIG